QHTESFSTPSPVWVEYQRERFGLGHSHSHSNSNSNPLVLTVRSTHVPPVDVDVDVLVTPKVETTSRRHSEQAAEDEDESLVPSMQGFLKFLKQMQGTWIKKSALSIENKIKLLKNLRDNLMKVIEEQFSVLWQPTERHRRRRRGLLEESNLDFPPEAALMSINFLTFAVFLIKLVLVSLY
ncbi:hypothetical protein KR222_010925, partial [Zaprionus bogoriensis]